MYNVSPRINCWANNRGFVVGNGLALLIFRSHLYKNVFLFLFSYLFNIFIVFYKMNVYQLNFYHNKVQRKKLGAY
jgi:hypothetical protein